MRLKLVKYIVLSYCALLIVSVATFYMLPEYPEKIAAQDQRQEWSFNFESKDGWQDQFEEIHVREQWQFAAPGDRIEVTATESTPGLWVLAERADIEEVEVMEYGTMPQMADLIKSYEVELRGGQLVITPPRFYELRLASYSRDFTEVQFFRGENPGPEYAGHSFGSLLHNHQIMLIKVPEEIDLDFDEKKIHPIVIWD